MSSSLAEEPPARPRHSWLELTAQGRPRPCDATPSWRTVLWATTFFDQQRQGHGQASADRPTSEPWRMGGNLLLKLHFICPALFFFFTILPPFPFSLHHTSPATSASDCSVAGIILAMAGSALSPFGLRHCCTHGARWLTRLHATRMYACTAHAQHTHGCGNMCVSHTCNTCLQVHANYLHACRWFQK